MDPPFVRPDERLRPHARNAAWNILERDYDILPDRTKLAFNILVDEEENERISVRLWAGFFYQAWKAGRPLPTRKLGSVVAADTSREKGEQDMTSMAKAYLAVLDSGRRGVTSLEARKYGEKGGGISGALTKLHQHGVIVCLERTR